MDNLNLKNQMPKNLAMYLLSFVTNILIGLWIIPYLVQHIGVAAYGLVPLAMVFSSYIGLIVQSLNSTINRYLLIALQKKDYLKANQVFNTALVMILLFIIVQFMIMIVILLNLSVIIDIPEGLVDDALYLFAFTFLGFSVSLVRAVISTPLFAHNRLDLLRTIDILQVLMRTGIIVILFTLESPELKYVGIANFIAALIVFFVAVSFSKKLAPRLKVDTTMIDLTQMRELSTMGGWVIVNQIGSLLFLQIDLFIANKFLGATQAGNYAIVVQWNSLFRVFAGMLSGVLSPIVMIYYARNELPKMVQMLKTGFKAMAIIMAIPLGIVSAMAGDLLAVWMGENFRYLENLLIFSLIPLVINLAVYPLFAVNIAFNKIKIPSIVTLVLGVVNLMLAILLVTKTELGLYAIVLAGGIVLTIKNTIFLPVYTTYILDLPRFTFMRYHFLGIGFFLVSFVTAKYFSGFITIDSLLSFLFISSGSMVIILLLVSLYVMFDPSMKSIVSEILSRKKSKRKVV